MKTTLYTLVLPLLFSHVYASAISKNKGVTFKDFFASLSDEEEFFHTKSEISDFFTAPSESMDRSPFNDEADTDYSKSTYVIFCKGKFSASANRCGGECAHRWIQPETCTPAPGTNCVQLSTNNAKDFDVRNHAECKSGNVARLASLPKHKCISKGGCYDTPKTQSFFYYG